METTLALFRDARSHFPDLTKKADRQHIKYWDELNEEQDSYSWFESVSRALNQDMKNETNIRECEEFFRYIDRAFSVGSAEVKNCIDVAFVENLFWEVPSNKAGPYWHILPEALKDLYVSFHARTPL